MPPSAADAAHLPVPSSSPAALLGRTQARLVLLRAVVQESSAAYWYELGKEAVEHKEWDAAIHYLARALQLDAQHSAGQALLADSYFQRAWVHRHSAAYDRAIDDFTTCAALEQENSYYALYNRGTVEEQLQHYPEALADYQLVAATCDLQRYPTMVVALDAAARICRYRLHDVASAVDYYVKITASGVGGNCAHHVASAHLKLGDLARDSQHYQEALNQYTAAIEISPTIRLAHNNRGITRYKLGDYAGALADAHQAVSLLPDNAVMYFNRGIARRALGDYAGALLDFDQALLLDAKLAQAYKYRADVKAKLGDEHGANRDRAAFASLSLPARSANASRS